MGPLRIGIQYSEGYKDKGKSEMKVLIFAEGAVGLGFVSCFIK